MKIIIKYDSIWRNKLLKGSNNEPLPDKAYSRPFNGSSKGGVIEVMETSKNTVMGILNRLIGDRRKLYQARESSDYYFKDSEKYITFKDIPKNSTNELVYLQNKRNNSDPNSSCGMRVDHILCEKDAQEVYKYIFLGAVDLYRFIVGGELPDEDLPTYTIEDLIDRMNFINNKQARTKDYQIELEELDEEWKETLSDILGEEVRNVTEVYTHFIRTHTRKLKAEGIDVSKFTGRNAGEALNVSPTSFDTAGVISNLYSGSRKYQYGGPLMYRKKPSLIKEDGVLVIDVDLEYEKCVELSEMIEDAKISTLKLGKKGLAWVEDVQF